MCLVTDVPQFLCTRGRAREWKEGIVDIREDKAWLLQSRFNPFPVSGALALGDGRISFTLDEDAGDAALDWLEKQLELDDIASRIRSGETVVAFDYALDDCAVSWPITGGGAMMIVRTPSGRKWVVSYDYPSGGSISQTMSLLTGRSKAREWKKLLAQAGA
jgi:hypothetical protein